MSTRNIELVVELDASPEEVFRAVTEGTELAKWIAPEAKVTPPSEGKRGSIWVSWGEGMAAGSPIEVFDPPRHFRHEFGAHPVTKAPLWADWSIESREGGRSMLRLVHSGFSDAADWDGEFESHARGWTLMVENLRHYLARHKHKSAAHIAFTKQAKTDFKSAWAALVSKRVMGFDAEPQPGDTYRITTSKGDALSGIVQRANGRDLALTVNELDDGLLRVSLEGGGKPGSSTYVYGYVIAYGDAAGRAGELAANMKKVLSDLG